ncbi:MAG TPA: sigma factor, partial [Gemmatimonadaceae bacterium]
MSQTSAAQGKSPALRVVAPSEREESLRQEMLKALPSVRAFSRSLCGSADQAEDILQETVANALTHLHTFKI